MTWGRQEDFLKQIEEMTGETPGGLKERPDLTPIQWYYRIAFEEVSASRGYSSNGLPLPVPLTEMLAYCQLYGIESLDEREKLIKMFRAMDAGYRKVASQEANSDKPKVPHPMPVKPA